MAITFVSSAEQNDTGATNPRTFTVDIGTRTNGLLVVCVTEVANASFVVASATYGGQAMAVDAQQSRTAAAPFHTVAILSLKNPPNGSNVLSVTFDSLNTTSGVSLFPSWYDGAHQTAGVDSTNGGTGTTDPTLDLSPAEANELGVSCYLSEANDILTAAQTLIQDHDLGVRVCGSSYVIPAATPTQTMSWAGVDDAWTMVVASYKQAAAAAVDIPYQPYYQRSPILAQ